MFRSLRVHIILIVLAGVLSAVLLLGIFLEYRSRVYFVSVTGEGLSTLAASTALELERQLADRLREVSALADMPDFRAAMLGNCQNSFVVKTRLHAASSQSGAFRWLGLADKHGNLCVSDGIDVPTTNLKSRAVFRNGLQAPWLGESLRQTEAQAVVVPGLDVSAPVLGPNGKPIGVLVGRLDQRWMESLKQKVLSPLLTGVAAHATILDAQGNVLISVGDTAPAALDISAIPATGAGGLAWLRSKDDRGSWVRGIGTMHSASSVQWVVVLSAAESAALSPLYAFRIDVLVGTILLLILTIYISIPVSEQLIRPLRTLRDAVVDLEQGRREGIPDIRSVAELETLSRAMQKMVESITSSERALVKMQDQAYTDPLTGLRNRRGMTEFMTNMMTTRADDELALMYVDLDFFKQINDTHGHAAGDAVLTAVADRMRAIFRSSDFLTRLGGDEFTAILIGEEHRGVEHFAEIADRLIAAIQQPIEYEDAVLEVSASVGVAVWDGEASLEAFLDLADGALYEAKQSGRGRTALASVKSAA